MYSFFFCLNSQTPPSPSSLSDVAASYFTEKTEENSVRLLLRHAPAASTCSDILHFPPCSPMPWIPSPLPTQQLCSSNSAPTSTASTFLKLNTSETELRISCCKFLGLQPSPSQWRATPSFQSFRSKTIESPPTPSFTPHILSGNPTGSTFQLYPDSDHCSPLSLLLQGSELPSPVADASSLVFLPNPQPLQAVWGTASGGILLKYKSNQISPLLRTL